MGKRRSATVALTRYSRFVTLEEVADRCDIPADLVRRLVALGLIDPPSGQPDLFQPEVAARVQRIMRLHRDLDINFNGVALVLDLLQRIEVLEARLARFRGR